MESTLIMNHQEISQRLERMAWQIWENMVDAEELFIIGIYPKGGFVAENIANQLKSICPINIHYSNLHIDKSDPLSGDITIKDNPNLKGKNIVLVDDVLNSGKTLMHACCHLMKSNPKSLITAILANRAHTQFPVKADVEGISLATTRQEHITFENLNVDDLKVYLQ